MLYPYKRGEAAKLLADDDTFAVVLMAILLPQYGDDLFEMDTAVLFKSIEEDFMCKLSEENENRINAAITCMTTDLFYTNLNVFKSVALAFNEGDIGGIPDGDDEELDAGEALWAMMEASLLTDEDDAPRKEYSKEIMAYVDSLIEELAEDEDEVDDEVDTVEEALKEPYFKSILSENCDGVVSQLVQVGMKKDEVQEIVDNSIALAIQ